METSLKMPVEGKPAVCLLDSGARCNECTPQFVIDRDLQYLPLEYVSWVPKDFMMVGLGGHMTRPLGVTVLEVDSPGISQGGKQDHIVFVVNDPSPYRQRVPVILGSNYLKYMVEATKESEGALLPPEMQEAGMAYKAWQWGMLHQHQAQFVMEPQDPEHPPGAPRPAPTFLDKNLNTGDPPTLIDDAVLTTRVVKLRPFSTTAIHARTKRVMPLTGSVNVITIAAPVKGRALKQCLTVVDSFSTMTKGSKSVTILLRNDSPNSLIIPRRTIIGRVQYAVEQQAKPADDAAALSALEDKFGPDDSEIKGVAARQQELLKRLEEGKGLAGMESWPEHMKQRARDLLCEFHDIFSLDKTELGHTDLGKHAIDLTDETPFKDRFSKIPAPLLAEVREEVDRMRATGVIRPSQSPWNNAVVLVRKKDGGLRFCVDFRKLNARTKKDAFPLPRINESLEALKGARYFSVMDQSSGFHQVPMEEKAIPYTAFSVASMGMYEFTRMPFGLCNAPATFQRLMQTCLGELNLTYALIYLDDVVVFSKDREGAIERLRAVFSRFRENNLKLKPSKCEFFKEEIDYLAHHVDKNGIRPSARNLDAIAKWAPPTTFTSLRGFLGIVGHYRRFIKDFARKAEPLFAYLQGDVAKKKSDLLVPSLNNNCKAMRAYDLLKEAVMSAPVLAFADYTKPFLLETDASQIGLGAVLSQKQEDGKFHPVAFGSRSLKASEKRYHSSRLEFLALKWAVTEHFEEYLRYKPFKVKTDNNPLTYVMTTAKLNACGIRWAQELASFDFELEYIKGKNNAAADALSRLEDRLPPDHADRISIQAMKMNLARREETQRLGIQQVRDVLDGVTGATEVTNDAAKADVGDETNRVPDGASLLSQRTAGLTAAPPPPHRPRGTEAILHRVAQLGRQPSTKFPRSMERIWEDDGEPHLVTRQLVRAILDQAADRVIGKVAVRTETLDPLVQAEADRIERNMKIACAERLPKYTTGNFDIPAVEGMSLPQRRAQATGFVNWANLQHKDPVLNRVMKWRTRLNAWLETNRKLEMRHDGRLDHTHRPRPDLEDVLGNLKDTPDGKRYLLVQKRLTYLDGKLYLRERKKLDGENMLLFIVPRDSRQLAINFCHDDAGHQGRDRTLSLIKERMWWPGMHQMVLDAVQKCWRCKKFEQPPVVARMIPLKATRPNELLHVDFTSYESDMDIMKQKVKPVKLMVMQDHFSKYVQVAIAENETAENTAWLIYNAWYRYFGLPARIITDRGPAFGSLMFKLLHKWLGVDHARTSPYHPQTNGLVERFNRTLKNMIGKMSKPRKDTWPNYLASAIMAYNCTRSAVTGYSPYFLMFGRRPRLPIDFYFPTVRDPPKGTKKISKQVDEILSTMKECCEEARRSNARESQRQTRFYNRRFNASNLRPGDKVLLRTDAFKGKRKLKDNWSDEVFTIVRQLHPRVPTFEIRSEGGNLKTAHRNRLLLYEPPLAAEEAKERGKDAAVDDGGRDPPALIPARRAQTEHDQPRTNNDTDSISTGVEKDTGRCPEEPAGTDMALRHPGATRCRTREVIDLMTLLRPTGVSAASGL